MKGTGSPPVLAGEGTDPDAWPPNTYLIFTNIKFNSIALLLNLLSTYKPQI